MIKIFNKENAIYFSIIVIILISFFAIFNFFQISHVYEATLAKVADNYTRENSVIELKKVPFTTIEENKMLNWDAEHYSNIKENRYRVARETNNIYLYAFFPLFSIIWDYTFLSNIGIGILNYFFFAISIFLLYSLYFNNKISRQDKILRFLLCFTTPLLVVYLIPYTEGVFMITLSFAFYGLIKNKYHIYFAAMLLAAMSRSVITILLISMILTTMLDIIKYKNYKFLLIDFLKKITPAFIGTFLVCLYQYLTGSGKFLIYIDAIKTWNNKFAIPHNITDWSHESFSIVIGIICLVIPLIIMYLLLKFITNIKKIKRSEASPQLFKTEKYNKEYLFNLSLIYTIGVFLTILFFKAGSLNGIPRYVLCSPFFYIIIFSLNKKLEYIKTENKILIFGALILISIFFLGMIPYSSFWNFSDMGLFIFLGFLMLWIFLEKMNKILQIATILLLLGINLVWNAYLFNSFLVNAWIFT